MEMFGTMIRFFQDGGLFMYPIALIAALGIAVAIERYFYLWHTEGANRRAWAEVAPFLGQGDYKRALAATTDSKSAIGQILSYGLARVQSARRRDDVEKAMEESLMEVVPRLERRTHYLASFANIATLLGLLGTIIGLIQAFQAVSTADPAEKAELLSASISVAMNTTAFGLIVAIPLLMLHSVLQSKTTQIVDSLEMASVKFLNTVVERRPENA
ncbi:MAG: MotA/TolQ/ExbB proton channel family protein [Gammaproteobacteria bacterium]|nr:MotA/TolQ/ExbB proton channel family protein [Gammaproteobacteria bacterium]